MSYELNREGGPGVDKIDDVIQYDMICDAKESADTNYTV